MLQNYQRYAFTLRATYPKRSADLSVEIVVACIFEGNYLKEILSDVYFCGGFQSKRFAEATQELQQLLDRFFFLREVAAAALFRNFEASFGTLKNACQLLCTI